MSMNISSVGGGGFGGIPTGSEMSSFSNTLKGAETGDLLKALGKDGMEPWQKDAIMKELENRAEKAKPEESGGAGGPQGAGGGGEEDEIKKLLKKLMKGTISPEELQKLAGALGVDPKALEGVKGGGDTSASSDSDIKGG